MIRAKPLGSWYGNACGSPGTVIRDAHKSVVSGLVLSGLEPVWVYPRYDNERHLAHPPSPENVAQALERNGDVAGGLITSPTPYGTCADITAIATLCHERGLPLLVDEAWGAHLPFHDRLPNWAMDADADLCLVSIHKMGAGLEQGSVSICRVIASIPRI